MVLLHSGNGRLVRIMKEVMRKPRKVKTGTRETLYVLKQSCKRSVDDFMYTRLCCVRNQTTENLK